MCVCVCVCLCVCVCVCVRVCIYVYMYMHMSVYMYAHIVQRWRSHGRTSSTCGSWHIHIRNRTISWLRYLMHSHARHYTFITHSLHIHRVTWLICHHTFIVRHDSFSYVTCQNAWKEDDPMLLVLGRCSSVLHICRNLSLHANKYMQSSRTLILDNVPEWSRYYDKHKHSRTHIIYTTTRTRKHVYAPAHAHPCEHANAHAHENMNNVTLFLSHSLSHSHTLETDVGECERKSERENVFCGMASWIWFWICSRRLSRECGKERPNSCTLRCFSNTHTHK